MAALILLVALYYERRWLLTAWLFPIGIFFAALIIPATGTYRMNVEAGAWQAVRQVDLIGNFKRFLTEESTLELRNGAAIIEHTRATGEYEYGAGYWNHLVFRYVPAQILGAEFKNSLRIGTEKQITAGESGLEYEAPTGSTVTGVGDCFQQFGWVGWLFFAFMAVIFRSLWVAAARPEAVFARLLYVLSLTSAMRAVTHWTLDFLPGLLYNLIFLGLAVLYAAAPRQTPRQKQPSRRRGRPVTKATPTAQGNPG
jgi:hypothetical protein